MENMNEYDIAKYSTQFHINVKIKNNLNRPNIIKELVAEGGPFGSRGLYLYAEKIHGSENIQHYVCNIMDNLITKCLEHGYLETLGHLMQSNNWINNHNTLTMYQTLIRPYKKEQVKSILDLILEKNPNYLHDKQLGSSNCSTLYHHVVVGEKELNIQDIRDLTGFLPFSTPLLSWSLFSQPDEQIPKFNSTLEFVKNEFPKDYHYTVVRDLKSYAKNSESVKLTQKNFEYLNDVFKQHASDKYEFQFLCFKELIKKYKKGVSGTMLDIFTEHLKALLPIDKYNKEIKKFISNKPNLHPLVQTMDSYIQLQKELPIQEKSRPRMKI